MELVIHGDHLKPLMELVIYGDHLKLFLELVNHGDYFKTIYGVLEVIYEIGHLTILEERLETIYGVSH